jgi:hypothetical protein
MAVGVAQALQRWAPAKDRDDIRAADLLAMLHQT